MKIISLDPSVWTPFLLHLQYPSHLNDKHLTHPLPSASHCSSPFSPGHMGLCNYVKPPSLFLFISPPPHGPLPSIWGLIIVVQDSTNLWIIEINGQTNILADRPNKRPTIKYNILINNQEKNVVLTMFLINMTN